MRLVFAGTPQVSVASLEALLDSRHQVVAVVTRPDAVAGRGHRVTPSHVSVAAREHGIPVLTPQRPSDPEFVQALQDLARAVADQRQQAAAEHSPAPSARTDAPTFRDTMPGLFPS